MSKQTDTQYNEITSVEKPGTRNKETFYLLCLLVVLWIIPYVTASGAGGLAVFGYMFLCFLSIIGAVILFLPIRWLVRLSFDGKKKTPPRIAILVIIAAVITYMVLNVTPWYVKDMKYEANKYYTENPQEFADPYEGKIIQIDVILGPYDTFFIYTNDNPPMKPQGGVVINYKNGWYFSGEFIPI